MMRGVVIMVGDTREAAKEKRGEHRVGGNKWYGNVINSREEDGGLHQKSKVRAKRNANIPTH